MVTLGKLFMDINTHTHTQTYTPDVLQPSLSQEHQLEVQTIDSQVFKMC
jgi:hypothetical protein